MLTLSGKGSASFAQSPPSLEQAARYLQQNQPKEAIEILQKVLEASPRDARAHNLLGVALSSSGRMEEASKHFRTAVEADPKLFPALKNLALNELKLGRPAEAEKYLRKYMGHAPADPAAHLALAEILFHKSQFAPAVEHYLQSQGLYMRTPPTVLNFARSCVASNQGQRAINALEMLGVGADGAAHFEAGVLLAQLERYTSAARHFEFARSKGYSDGYSAGYNQTLALVRGQDYENAIRVANEMIAAGHETAELYNLLGEAYEKSKETIKAYNALRRATQLAPRDEDNYLDLIALGVDHRNYDLALDIAEIALQNIPNSYRLLLQRGAVKAFRGQMNAAIEDFEAASKLDPRKNLPFYSIVMAMMQMDQLKEGIEILRKRVAEYPDDYLLLYALGESLNRLGTPRGSPTEVEALEALEKSVRLNPNFAAPRVALGRLLLRRGEIDRVIEELERALELQPTELSPCYPLAQAYRRKGNTKRADELMAKFQQYKEEEKDRFMNVTVLRLLREGEK
jgi:tetratricopeptide (TPR) repeat protein